MSGFVDLTDSQNPVEVMSRQKATKYNEGDVTTVRGRRIANRHTDPSTVDDNSDDDMSAVVSVALDEDDPLQAVVAAFPDADIDEAKSLLEEYENNLEVVFDHMLSNGYQKAASNGAQTSSSSSSSSFKVLDFTSITMTTTWDYRTQAIQRLSMDFPMVSSTTIRLFFSACAHHYCPAAIALDNALRSNFKLEALYWPIVAGCIISPESRVREVHFPHSDKEAIWSSHDHKQLSFKASANPNKNDVQISVDFLKRLRYDVYSCFDGDDTARVS